MEGAGGAALRGWDSFRTSVSTAADIDDSATEDVEETTQTSPRLVDDRVFVAVPEDVRHGKSTLLWALENLAKDGARVVIAHVHCPAQMIPMSKTPSPLQLFGCWCRLAPCFYANG
jgi:hypothetical protein